MKHGLASAVLNGWTEALADLVNSGQISEEAATELVTTAARYSQDYTKGLSVNGSTLAESAEDDDVAFDNALTEWGVDARFIGSPSQAALHERTCNE